MTSVVETDVCVIGAGPAGLTFARQWVGSDCRVLVLEGGGYVRDDRADEQADSHIDSPHYLSNAMPVGRRRQFGGTANIWSHVTRPDTGRSYARVLAGECIDFDGRGWQSTSGWPIALSDLNPYYDQAAQQWLGHQLCRDAQYWSRPGTPPLTLRSGPLHTQVAQYGAADVFTLRYRDELHAADNIDVQVNSTVVELEADQGRIDRAIVLRSDGSRQQVYAKVFVLAGGGLENVQTLLHSELTRPFASGNRHDNVGRYITDHPEFLLGTIAPTEPDLMERLGLYDLHHVDSQLVSGLLTFDQGFKRDEELLNVAAVLVPQWAGFGSLAERAIRSLHPMRSGQLPERPLQHLRTIAAAPRDTAALLHNRLVKRRRLDRDYPAGYVWHRGGWSRPGVDRSQFKVLEVHVATEQTPHREHQLTLGPGRDSLSRQRLRLRLGWSANDHANLLRSMEVLAAEIEGSGIGRFHRWVDFTGPTKPVTHGLHHPMGGTRMHEDPKVGVVDRDCKVHGVPNLYLAGSSVFTTGLGYANPTLTIAALSTRLAEHLQMVVGAVKTGGSTAYRTRKL